MAPERKVASPPTLAPPNPAPWNESQNDTVLNRPVAARASLSAISMASEPDGASNTLPRSPGAISAERMLNLR